jgi:hypothetical protein
MRFPLRYEWISLEVRALFLAGPVYLSLEVRGCVPGFFPCRSDSECHFWRCSQSPTSRLMRSRKSSGLPIRRRRASSSRERPDVDRDLPVVRIFTFGKRTRFPCWFGILESSLRQSRLGFGATIVSSTLKAYRAGRAAVLPSSARRTAARERRVLQGSPRNGSR